MFAQFEQKFQDRHKLAQNAKNNGKKVVGYFYSLVPKELIHAAGILPVQLTEEKGIEYDEKSHTLPYLCGLGRNVTGQIYEKVYSYLDAVAVATVCDTNRHVLDVWEKRQIVPNPILVRLPGTLNDAAINYYTKELNRLCTIFGDIAGAKVTDDKIAQSIRLYNENRSLMKQLYDFRAKDGDAVTALGSLNVVKSSLIMPVEEHNEMLKKLLASLPPATGSGKGKVRLMVCAVNFNIAADTARIAERFGAQVVTDDFTNGVRYASNMIETAGDPLKALAKGYLMQVPSPGVYSFQKRADMIEESMKNAGAKGLIYMVQQYCDAFAFEYAIMKEKFDAKGLSYLQLEAEDTPASVEHLNVRIQSFIESLS